jgi:2,3-bisphosphoglycerate-independent phosphoglycerate mutase
VVAVLVIPDGAAQPLRRDGRTALDAARTPVLDALAATGEVARVAVTPAGLPAGSEAGVPALLGHTPERPLGRGRIDAAGYGVPVPAGLVPWRADVLREDGSRATAGMARMLAAALGGAWTRGHRLVLFAPQGTAPTGGTTIGDSADGASTRAWAGTGGADGASTRAWAGGATPAGVRVWADGAALPRLLDEATVVVAARGAAAGCARLLGAALVVPPGATGDVDTDLHGKARAALGAIERGAERVVVHVGAPDEAAHRRDAGAKVAALEALDSALLGPLRDAVARAGGTLAVCPDHGTDPRDGSHDAAPVPALRWGARVSSGGPARMTEAAVADAPVRPPSWPLGSAALVEAAA